MKYGWELGLQTAHNKTLKHINRGHDFQCYQATTKEARRRGLKGVYASYYRFYLVKIIS